MDYNATDQGRKPASPNKFLSWINSAVAAMP
jgi:hypothetical protein